MKHWFFTIQKTPKRETMTIDEVMSVLHAHTAYFKDLGKQGICLMAGPFVNQTDNELGAGCYVLAAENEMEARKLAEADPLFMEGIYDYKVWEWTKVVPE